MPQKIMHADSFTQEDLGYLRFGENGRLSLFIGRIGFRAVEDLNTPI
jgi:hypothetical protein